MHHPNTQERRHLSNFVPFSHLTSDYLHSTDPTLYAAWQYGLLKPAAALDFVFLAIPDLSFFSFSFETGKAVLEAGSS